jgi:hypothetical protein
MRQGNIFLISVGIYGFLKLANFCHVLRTSEDLSSAEVKAFFGARTEEQRRTNVSQRFRREFVLDSRNMTPFIVFHRRVNSAACCLVATMK